MSRSVEMTTPEEGVVTMSDAVEGQERCGKRGLRSLDGRCWGDGPCLRLLSSTIISSISFHSEKIPLTGDLSKKQFQVKDWK